VYTCITSNLYSVPILLFTPEINYVTLVVDFPNYYGHLIVLINQVEITSTKKYENNSKQLTNTYRCRSYLHSTQSKSLTKPFI